MHATVVAVGPKREEAAPDVSCAAWTGLAAAVSDADDDCEADVD